MDNILVGKKIKSIERLAEHQLVIHFEHDYSLELTADWCQRSETDNLIAEVIKTSKSVVKSI